MPQNNVLPDWRATYPLDAPVQKPGGVTVLTTATAPRVPNKHVFAAGTIQMLEVAEAEAEEAVNAAEEAPEEEVEAEEDPTPPTRGRSRRR